MRDGLVSLTAEFPAGAAAESAGLTVLKGWVPETKELKDYFLGYNWYQENPEVKVDPALLNADKRRLYDIIVAEEKRRGW
jgi:hypothetical protein